MKSKRKRAWASEGPDRSKAVYKLCPQLITRISRSAAFLTGPACQPVIDWCNLQVRHPVVLYDGVKNLMLVPVLLLARRLHEGGQVD